MINPTKAKRYTVHQSPNIILDLWLDKDVLLSSLDVDDEKYSPYYLRLFPLFMFFRSLPSVVLRVVLPRSDEIQNITKRISMSKKEI